ncbi:CdaR family protein [Bacillus sp. Marseille-P3661]|uniref:CdaR family protein n=1 Tax=Bacillus sp. Marseille-P3661 TaxID=1936234 RepID=UPI000C834A2C|nr:CdaR family protein [Bacillus sp. Marseille-P3661]
MLIDKWLNSPWFVRIVALFLALMLYTAVNMETQTNPKPSGILQTTTETEALSNIPLQVIYNEDKFVISELPQTVNVYVDGTNSVIKAMKAQEGYEVYVDLSNLSAGKHNIRVQHRGFSNKLKVNIDPAMVTVEIQDKVEQIMPITIEKLNQDKLPQGYTSDEPIIVPNSVKVRGSRDDVKRIGFVKGFLDIEGVMDTVKKDVAINVYDLNGEQLNLEVEPSVVEVQIPISPPYKAVPFKVNRKGTLPNGMSIKSFEVSPTEITVYGPYEVIETIEMIDNIDVNLSTIDGDQTLEVKVPVPEGAIKVNPEVISIKVDVEEEESKVLTNVPIKLSGSSNLDNVSIITPLDGLVNLRIFGAEDVIQNIQPEDFDIRLNVGGFSQGEHEIDIEVVSGPQNVRWEITPSKALIEINNG